MPLCPTWVHQWPSILLGYICRWLWKKKVLLVDKYYVILCRGDKTKRFLTWPHMLWTFWRPRINDCEHEERLAPVVCDLPVGVCMYLIHVINEKANRKSNQASGHRTKDSHLALRVRGNQWRGNMTPVSAFQFQTKSHLCRQLCHKGVSVFCKKRLYILKALMRAVG